ncbi:MAG: Gfo/Idh/MocA family oxidoreductase [Candidatus Solibacter sp.]
MNSKDGITRRKALALGAATAGFTFIPARVLGREDAPPPSDKMNLAFMGLGLAGRTQVNAMSSQNIVALCDVDWREGSGRGMMGAASAVAKQHPEAKRFDDWRVMLQEMDKSIDGLVVNTPDHTHAHAVIMAMKMGKHIFCEKPLGHSMHETRALMAAEKKYKKLTTSTCIQGHASEDCRSLVEWVRDGAIGEVREAHVYEYETVRPGAPSYYDDLKHVNDDVPVPPELKWDLFIGPAPSRPFNPMYHPNKFRYWYDFGTGKLGDHGPHYIDPVYWALDLGMPETIEAEADPAWDTVTDKTQKYPQFAVVRYGFPARGKKPPVTMTWHHTDQKPPLPKWLKPEDQPPSGGGMIVGTNGAIVFGPIYASKPGAIQQVKLYPEELNRDYKRPAPTIPRIATSHWMEWVECAKAGKPTSADFAYGGAISELALLGDIAIRNKGTMLHYDAKGGKFKEAEANRFFQREYRKGWELPT